MAKMPEISAEGYIFILMLILFLVIFGTTLRIYLMRHTHGIAAKASNGILVVYGISVIVSVVILTCGTVLEINLLKNHTIDEIPALLIDVKYLKIYLLAVSMYTTHLWTLKLAFICYYYDLARHLGKGVRIILYCILSYTITAFLVNLLLLYTYCLPIHRAWSLGPDNCMLLDRMLVLIFSAVTHIIGDIAIFTLPMYIVATLQLRGREKLGVLFVFSIGAMSIIASAVRFYLVYEPYKIKASKAKVNPLDSIHAVAIWSAIEIFFGFTAFVLPSLRTLIRKRTSTTGSPNAPSKVRSAAAKNSQRPECVTDVNLRGLGENSRLRVPVSTRTSIESRAESQTELQPWRELWQEITTRE